jgi:hypothetical protein
MIWVYEDSVRTSKRNVCASIRKTNWRIHYTEKIAVDCKHHTQHLNALRGQNVEYLVLNLTLHVVTAWIQRVNRTSIKVNACVYH